MRETDGQTDRQSLKPHQSHFCVEMSTKSRSVFIKRNEKWWISWGPWVIYHQMQKCTAFFLMTIFVWWLAIHECYFAAVVSSLALCAYRARKQRQWLFQCTHISTIIMRRCISMCCMMEPVSRFNYSHSKWMVSSALEFPIVIVLEILEFSRGVVEEASRHGVFNMMLHSVQCSLQCRSAILAINPATLTLYPQIVDHVHD